MLDVGREPGAGGGSGESGCCRYSCRSVELLLRRRLLPSRWASRVAWRGRTEALLPLGVSQVSSSLRRLQGRGPCPAPARQPSAPPKPYLSAPGEDRGPTARGAGVVLVKSGSRAASLWAAHEAGFLKVLPTRRSTFEKFCTDLVAVVTFGIHSLGPWGN